MLYLNIVLAHAGLNAVSVAASPADLARLERQHAYGPTAK